jgi:hypothetical protein
VCNAYQFRKSNKTGIGFGSMNSNSVEAFLYIQASYHQLLSTSQQLSEFLFTGYTRCSQAQTSKLPSNAKLVNFMLSYLHFIIYDDAGKIPV